MRAGSFRHTPELDQLTPFPVPWSYPDESALQAPKYPSFKNKPFPSGRYRFKPPTFDPFPHKKNPNVKRVPKENLLRLPSHQAKLLARGRGRFIFKGGTAIGRLRLMPGQKITDVTNAYIAKVLSPKQAGTSYPVYILRIMPDFPERPGRDASDRQVEAYNTRLLKWQYQFDRASYWENVRFFKEKRADIVEASRAAFEKQLAKAKKQYYKSQARARIEYEREVSKAQTAYKQAVREYQVSKIGSYYGNKYFSLYGSYY